MEYIKNPMMIESKSFEMIQDIIDDIRPGYKFKNEIEEKIIKRSIHTTADFEYLDILKISETAVENIIDALKNNATIYTDTNMALSGINKKRLDTLGCKYKCLVADNETANLAREK
ncbi:MAG: precorrin-8X methylmutase, partial [Romboutsia sp.]|uniref:precorrin-8X methylmutase n=1 Tax=Romboutsia sp. TaxID=1965302 RepID=UPI003F3CD50C